MAQSDVSYASHPRPITGHPELTLEYAPVREAPYFKMALDIRWNWRL